MPRKQEVVDLYEIKITLMYLEPAIWRRVVVPKDITLGALHAPRWIPTDGSSIAATFSRRQSLPE